MQCCPFIPAAATVTFNGRTIAFTAYSVPSALHLLMLIFVMTRRSEKSYNLPHGKPRSGQVGAWDPGCWP